MSKAMYTGISALARKIKKMYVGVGGVARKVKKVYIGVGGVARLCFSQEVPAGSVTFTSSAVWTVPENVNTVTAFLVGGGGSGAIYNPDGSGGGGGYTKTQVLTVIPGAQYSVIVGAGGVAPSSWSSYGADGGSSSIGALVSASGGRGGTIRPMVGTYGSGGSGGGISGDQTENGVILSNTINENGGDGGYDGSNGYVGAQAAYDYSPSAWRIRHIIDNTNTFCRGQGSTTRAWGNAGDVLYAGGGGGGCGGNTSSLWAGAGGLGGGGVGASGSSSASAGTPNTGGGGGSGVVNYNFPAKAGGSGIVIIKWAAQ